MIASMVMTGTLADKQIILHHRSLLPRHTSLSQVAHPVMKGVRLSRVCKYTAVLKKA